MDKEKFCCFADETGQDTHGEFFLVSIVILEQSARDSLESVIEAIEVKTAKNRLKWGNTDIKVKKEFLQEVLKVRGLKQSLFYSVYKDTKKYNYLTSVTIAKVMEVVAVKDYFVLIVVDGLNKREMERMRVDIKKLGVSYSHIKGLKDEQSVFLRLADTVAGFVRDYLEGDKYAQVFFDDFVKRGFLQEV